MQTEIKSIKKKTDRIEKVKHSLRIPIVTAGVISALVISFIFNQTVQKQNKNKNEAYEEFSDILGI